MQDVLRTQDAVVQPPSVLHARSNFDVGVSARSSIWSPIVMGAVAVVLVVGVIAFWPIVIDDAYITARYATNLANGVGPVFNPGQRVEGYSDPVWLIIMTFVVWLSPAHVMLVAKVVGVLATLGIFVTAGAVLQRRGAGAAGVASLLVFALLAPVIFWSVAGLETTLYCALALLSLVIFEDRVPSTGQAAVSGTLVALAALTRPEGAALIVPVAVSFAFRARKQTKRAVLGKSLATLVAVFAVLWGSYLGFRLAYFGKFVPNTYLAKPGGPAHVRTGVHYVINGFANPAALLLLLGAIVGGARWASRSPIVAACLVAAALQTGFTVWAGGDWMPESRFLLPVWTFLLIPAGLGLAVIWQRVLCSSGRPTVNDARLSTATRLSNNARLRSAAVVLFGIVLIGMQTVSFVHSYNANYWRLANGLSSRLDFGTWLNATVSPKFTIAYGDMGALPYESSARFIDFNGLVDRNVANILHGTGRPDEKDARIGQYVLNSQPDMIIIVAGGPSPITSAPTEYGKSLVHDSAFVSGYHFSTSLVSYRPGAVPGWATGRYLQIFLHNGITITGLDQAVDRINASVAPA